MTELDQLIEGEVWLANLEIGARLDAQRARGVGHPDFLAEVDGIQRDWAALREGLPAMIRAKFAGGEASDG